MGASFQGDILITDFTGGELSPRWFSRVQGGGMDPLQGGGNVSSQYQSGSRQINNMIVLPQGGVTKRTGFLYGRNLTADVPGINADDVQVFKFEQTGTDFITVWSPLNVKVYSTATFDINVTLPSPVASFTTPYNVSDIRDMQVAQLQDSMIVFDNHHRMRILRLRLGVWAFLDAQDAGYVAPTYDYRDQNSPPTTAVEYNVEFIVNRNRNAAITVSNFGATSVLLANGSTISASAVFLIAFNNQLQTLTNFTNGLKACAAVNASSVQVVWTGTGNLLKYNVKYTVLGSVGDGTGSLNIQLTNENNPPVQDTETITVTAIVEGTSGVEPLWSGPGVVLHNAVYYQCILAHIALAVTEPGVGAQQATYWTSLGATLPTGTDYTLLYGGKPWALNLAAGTYNRGWPSTGTAHEQRMLANGPPPARGVVAGSRTGIGRFLDFTVGVNANDGFVFLLVVANGMSVVWLHSQKFLFVGTSVGVFVQTQIPLAPTNVNFSRQSNYALDAFRGFDVAGEVFYVQRNGRQMRRMQFVNDLQSYQASDMTAYAEHLFTEGNRVRDQSYMNSPDTILWVLRTDGGLMSFTYERFYGVAAWAKHNTVGGTIRAIETFFGGVARKDMLAACVTRQVWNGSAFVNNVYLEVLAETSRNEFGSAPNSTTGDWDYAIIAPRSWYARLDAVQQLVGAGTTTITVDVRFRNKTVTVQEDGVVLGQFLASAGAGVITLPQPTVVGSNIYVGYGYPAKIVPTALEVAASLTAQSQVQRWARPMMRLFASTMPIVNGQPVRERSVADLYNVVSGLYTGDVTIVNIGTGGDLTVEANEPLPFQMTGLFGLLSVNSGDN